MRKNDDYDQELLAKLDDLDIDSSDDENPTRLKNTSTSTKIMIKVVF